MGGELESGFKHHWNKWKELCLPMEEGGAGLRSFADVFNAFSVKLWWNFRQHASLWADFMWAKYCKNLHPIEAPIYPCSSYTWKRMIQVRDVAEKHICWLP